MLRLRIYIIALTSIALAACDQGGNGSPKGGAAVEQPPSQVVTVITATSRPVVLTDRLPGRVVAFRKAEVRPQIDGLIETRLFEEGSTVEAGRNLYQIAAESFEAALNAARADLAKARASSALAQKKLSRYQRLLKTQAASRQAYDDAVSAADQADAAVAAAEAQVEVAEINLTYTKVKAPISGLIGRSEVSEGALVTKNQVAALATITQLDPVYVDLTQSSSKLLNIRQRIADGNLKAVDGVPVTLKLDGVGSQYKHLGQLQFSEVIVDEGTSSVTLRAVFPNPDKVLLPGMFVRAEVAQGRLDNGFLIPQKAVQRAPSGDAFVYIVGQENKVARRSVTLDRAIEQDWLVKSGLKNGDKVIVAGLLKVRDGVPVVPEEIETKSGQMSPSEQS